MKKVLTYGLVAFGIFVVGLLIGVTANVGDRYQAGRLSACTEMTAALNPLFMNALHCVPYQGDVAIKIGGKLFSLDGKKQLN